MERICLRSDVQLLRALEIAGSGWVSRMILKKHFQEQKRDTSLQAEKEPREPFRGRGDPDGGWESG